MKVGMARLRESGFLDSIMHSYMGPRIQGHSRPQCQPTDSSPHGSALRVSGVGGSGVEPNDPLDRTFVDEVAAQPRSCSWMQGVL